jgi:SAM-dependent methyltransferase
LAVRLIVVLARRRSGGRAIRRNNPLDMAEKNRKQMTLPPCPITGKPAKRRIHGVSTSVVKDIWRRGQGVDVSHLFEGIDRVTLYESQTGLVFFEPRIVGDGKFYASYYRTPDVQKGLSYRSDQRADYIRAAAAVPAGTKVIDIGCGPGLFRRHLRQAHFTGLDPYAPEDADNAVIREALEAHAAKNTGAYDVVTAFHVIEHVADPLNHAALMVRLLKPGGLLILAAPLHPSILTEIPNFPFNVPPHHVTWWNPQAFGALGKQLGLEVIEATTLPSSPHQGQIQWLHRLLFKRTDKPPHERYYAHRWSWHFSLVLALVLSRIATRIKPMPSNPSPVDAFFIARKPAA